MGSVALLFESGHDAGGPRIVPFSHFVDERDGVLEERDFRLEVLEKALLRGLAVPRNPSPRRRRRIGQWQGSPGPHDFAKLVGEHPTRAALQKMLLESC